jgi:hypothetical protein
MTTNKKPSKFGAITLVFLLAVAGVGLLLISHAQTPYATAEAEAGTLSGSATVESDTNASDGSYVQFGSTTTTTTPAPSDLFDLSEWNLTLPVDSTGGNGGTVCPGELAAAVITTQQLLAGFTDPYFQINSSGQLIFTDPSDGATTTPCSGSNHTRSELHEYYTGTNAATNGCWTSAVGGTLQASAVVNVASTGSDEATIGQIHGNGGAAFTLLKYRPAEQELLLSVYTSPADTASTDTVLLSNVTIGETINYSLSFNSSGLITATANGTTVTVTAGSGWDTYPVRFALGAYSAAPNTANPTGAETQVSFSSFKITH